jgi:hypothetical protein
MGSMPRTSSQAEESFIFQKYQYDKKEVTARPLPNGPGKDANEHPRKSLTVIPRTGPIARAKFSPAPGGNRQPPAASDIPGANFFRRRWPDRRPGDRASRA